MKIFIVSTTHPSINSSTNILIKNILKNFENNEKLKTIWLIYQHIKFDDIVNESSIITPIQNYSDAVEVLKKYQPDFVLTNNNKFADIHYAFSLASNFLKIPLVQYKNADLSNHDLKHTKQNSIYNLKRNLIQFFSRIPNDSSSSRSSFIIYKKKFLFKTKKSIGYSYFKNIKSQISNYIYPFFGNQNKRFTNLCDLQLVHNEVWLKILNDGGVNPSKFSLIGNPYWDTLFETSQLLSDKKEPISSKPIRVLICTVPLFEHGFWKFEQQEKFLTNLIQFIKKESNLSCSFKIHPSSENINYYKNIFKKFNVTFPIYQKENFWHLVQNFDIVLSYGFSTLHTECALLGFRMILLETNLNIREMPLVKTGIQSGFIEKCNNLTEIYSICSKLCNQKIFFNENHLTEIKKTIYKFDGKSGYRAAEAIIKLLSKKKT